MNHGLFVHMTIQLRAFFMCMYNRSETHYWTICVLIENFIRQKVPHDKFIYKVCQQYLDSLLPSKSYVSKVYRKWHEIRSIDDRNSFQL